MLEPRHLATLRAAPFFWSDEMHSEELMRPYLDTHDDVPLTKHEVASLRAMLQPANLRYAAYDIAARRLVTTELFPTAEPIASDDKEYQVATVLLPPT